MLRWSSHQELRNYLDQSLGDEGWAQSGHYVRWLVQNAFLLPTYLMAAAPPVFGGVRLDSWQAVRDAIMSDRAVIDLIAERVSGLYLGSTWG
jgi:hypothetical protein